MRTHLTPGFFACLVAAFCFSACGGGGNGDGGGDNPPADPPPFPLVAFSGLRSFDGGATVHLLGFASVSPSTEDRTVVHFEVPGLPISMTTAYCHIPVDNIDEGGPAGTFEVYRFFGDGVASTDEWNMGTLTDQFTGIAGDRVLTINVTSYLQHCDANGLPYLSLVLRAGTGQDRYNLGEMATLESPWIEVVP